MSAKQLSANHVRHPGVPAFFARSTLAIGSRGAGKTFLLRHRRIEAHPEAVYVSLQKTLKSLTTDAGVGGRALVYPPELADQMVAKTAAIIVATIAEQLEDDEQRHVTSTALTRVIGSVITPALWRGIDRASAKTARRGIDRIALDRWPAIHRAQFFEAIEDLYALSDDRLAIFLDRADDIPLPALGLLLGLLDQSIVCTTVIAARPSIARVLATEYDPNLVAGDHYALVHIGANPYSPRWHNFMKDAVGKFLRANAIWDDRRHGWPFEWTSHFARDSPRDAIQLIQNVITDGDPQSTASRHGVLIDFREQRLSRARSALTPRVHNFSAFVELLHNRAGDQLMTSKPRPLHLTFDEFDHQLALGYGTRDAKVLALLDAIRAEAFHLPAEKSWAPYGVSAEVELAPVLAWNPMNTAWIQ